MLHTVVLLFNKIKQENNITQLILNGMTLLYQMRVNLQYHRLLNQNLNLNPNQNPNLNQNRNQFLNLNLPHNPKPNLKPNLHLHQESNSIYTEILRKVKNTSPKS